VEDEELEQILDKNFCHTQLDLISELGMTQQVHFLSPTKAMRMILLQNNTRFHKVKKTLETIADLGWEILPHAYFPDLTHSDYHLFRSLQYLSKSQFKSVE